MARCAWTRRPGCGVTFERRRANVVRGRAPRSHGRLPARRDGGVRAALRAALAGGEFLSAFAHARSAARAGPVARDVHANPLVAPDVPPRLAGPALGAGDRAPRSSHAPPRRRPQGTARGCGRAARGGRDAGGSAAVDRARADRARPRPALLRSARGGGAPPRPRAQLQGDRRPPGDPGGRREGARQPRDRRFARAARIPEVVAMNQVPALLRQTVERDLRPVRPLQPAWVRALALLPLAAVALMQPVLRYSLRRDVGFTLSWGLSAVEVIAGMLLV